MRMFSIKGDAVLDPFLGSGTTTKSAIENGRNSIGYETDEDLLPVIKKKIDFKQALNSTVPQLSIVERRESKIPSN